VAPSFNEARLRPSIFILLGGQSSGVVALLGVMELNEVSEVSASLPPSPPPHLLTQKELVLLLLPFNLQLGLPLAAREHSQPVTEPQIGSPRELEAYQVGKVLRDCMKRRRGDCLSRSLR